jgi:hypothetical protein
VVNPDLKAAIQNLIKSQAKRVLLDTRIVVAASNKLSRIIKSSIPSIVYWGTVDVSLLGVLAPLKSVMLSFAAYGVSVAGLAYSAIHYFPILIANAIPGGGTVIASAIIALATISTPQVQRSLVPLTGTCSQFVRAVPKIEVIDNLGNSYIIQYVDEAFEAPSGNVYFYDAEHNNKYYSDVINIKQLDMKFHVKTKLPNSGVCEYQKIESLKNEIAVKETCTPHKHKYVPLSQRTMNLSDLDRRDKNVREITDNAQYALEAYERTSSKYAAKRIKEHNYNREQSVQNSNEINKKTGSSSRIDQLLNDFVI